MATNKRITDLTDYTSVLPYASEMFGVYQPMIGWKSKRIVKRLNQGLIDAQDALLKSFAKNYDGISDPITANVDCVAQIKNIHVGKLSSTQLSVNNSSILLRSLVDFLPKDKPPLNQEWKDYIKLDLLEKILNEDVAVFYKQTYRDQCNKIQNVNIDPALPPDEIVQLQNEKQRSLSDLTSGIQKLVNEESAIAGSLLGMLDHDMFAQLETIFYKKPDTDLILANQQIAEMLNSNDPFLTFDPKKDIKNVCLSPLGIVHLFRQYFFELDSFLGTPTGHIWLSPGATVELMEISTRRSYIEKTVELSTESTTKTETSTSDKDEISDAVKSENKNDLKLGASATVNQSWGSGNSSATASLNMDNTQQTAREVTHKRMREQSQKLSSEIKQSYKSTFKTITETTDTSSKRYVLSNTTQLLINYELRRKMRQVGVQVQDIGTYLCWETFVDEPGNEIGLANLVHIAQPAELEPQPSPVDVATPPKEIYKTIKGSATWDTHGSNDAIMVDFLPLTELDVMPPDEGYMVKKTNEIIPVGIISTSPSNSSMNLGGKLIVNDTRIQIGAMAKGVQWDEQITFQINVTLAYVLTPTKLQAIADANNKLIADKLAASNDTMRKQKDAFYKAAKERIEFASNINTRKYEDLREEERIIVYRNLIGTLMSEALYNMPETKENSQTRHTLSELINSIFDIDKMLYFVAPEWWKPRTHYHQALGTFQGSSVLSSEVITNWADQVNRPDNYYITEKSNYAKMGSSLGWMLQLDGDDMRNAFLNAPWVKAVIPIRPGKELEATNWLQQMGVEGADGLDALYQTSDEELNKIKAVLNISTVTIGDAVRYLCAEVAQKHKDSLQVDKYPKEEINDDNKVSATPIDKVYEHGFYPLKDGFKAVTSDKFEVFDQWIEVLPTDQVVPVEVNYDPKTGRQI
jgi:hypothetical protein